MARASTPIWRPVSCHSVRLKLMPVVIGKANLVVSVLLPEATPVEASLHQSYFGRFSEGMVFALMLSCPIFSGSDMREMASATRLSIGSV